MYVIDIYIKYNHLRKVDTVTPRDLIKALACLNSSAQFKLHFHQIKDIKMMVLKELKPKYAFGNLEVSFGKELT